MIIEWDNTSSSNTLTMHFKNIINTFEKISQGLICKDSVVYAILVCKTN